jgi:hypothetical protein
MNLKEQLNRKLELYVQQVREELNRINTKLNRPGTETRGMDFLRELKPTLKTILEEYDNFKRPPQFGKRKSYIIPI